MRNNPWEGDGLVLTDISVYSSIDCGASINFLKCLSHWAPTAPSTTRWSHDIVTFIIDARVKPAALSAGTNFSLVPPTARMHDWGGLMMAVK